jgi:hypothetical protein
MHEINGEINDAHNHWTNGSSGVIGSISSGVKRSRKSRFATGSAVLALLFVAYQSAGLEIFTATDEAPPFDLFGNVSTECRTANQALQDEASDVEELLDRCIQMAEKDPHAPLYLMKTRGHEFAAWAKKREAKNQRMVRRAFSRNGRGTQGGRPPFRR